VSKLTFTTWLFWHFKNDFDVYDFQTLKASPFSHSKKVSLEKITKTNIHLFTVWEKLELTTTYPSHFKHEEHKGLTCEEVGETKIQTKIK